MTSQTLFGLAVAHQQVGRRGEAAGLCAQILKAETAHPMRLFQLGMIRNSVYWRRFGVDAVRSIHETCTGAHLHVHLVDPTDGDIDHARSLSNASLGIDISTAEGPGRDCADRQLAKTYYACIRFGCLYQLLEAYQRPIM